MEDYIKRDELLRRYDEYYCKPCREKGDDYNGVRCRACGTGDAIETAEDIPAVDAVEVIRCRDCKHRPIYSPKAFLGPILEPKNGDGELDSKCPFICSDPYYSSMPPDDHYCAYGERTKNGSNSPDEYPVCFNMI